MNKLKQYKSQIFTFVTIFLLATYGIFPALTAANTIYNIIGSIGLLLLVVWGALELYNCFIPFETDVKTSETHREIKPKTKRKPKTTK
jgi:putative Mn2+ efflux pump MntP